jgi:hypothetical protein
MTTKIFSYTIGPRRAPRQACWANSSPRPDVKLGAEGTGGVMFGVPTYTFKPSRANMIAVNIWGPVLAWGGVVGGGALLVLQPNEALAPNIIFGIVLLALGVVGIALLVWVKRTMSLRVFVCPVAIVRSYRGVTTTWGWDEIKRAEVRGSSRWDSGPHVICTIHHQNGCKWVFTTNNVEDISKLVEVIRAHLGPAFSFATPPNL